MPRAKTQPRTPIEKGRIAAAKARAIALAAATSPAAGTPAPRTIFKISNRPSKALDGLVLREAKALALAGRLSPAVNTAIGFINPAHLSHAARLHHLSIARMEARAAAAIPVITFTPHDLEGVTVKAALRTKSGLWRDLTRAKADRDVFRDALDVMNRKLGRDASKHSLYPVMGEGLIDALKAIRDADRDLGVIAAVLAALGHKPKRKASPSPTRPPWWERKLLEERRFIKEGWTPPLERNRTDHAKVAWWHVGLALIGPSAAFTLRLDDETEALLRKSKSPASWLLQRIAHRLKERFGRPIASWLALEVGDDGRIHAHGEIGIDATIPADRDAAREALIEAGGRKYRGSHGQLVVKSAPDLNWSGYCADDLDVPRPALGAHRRIAASREIVAASRDAYNEVRKILLHAHNTKPTAPTSAVAEPLPAAIPSEEAPEATATPKTPSVSADLPPNEPNNNECCLTPLYRECSANEASRFDAEQAPDEHHHSRLRDGLRHRSENTASPVDHSQQCPIDLRPP